MQMHKRFGWMVIVVLLGATIGMFALAFAPGTGRLVTAEAAETRPDAPVVQSAAAASLSDRAPGEVSMLVVGSVLIGLGAALRRAA